MFTDLNVAFMNAFRRVPPPENCILIPVLCHFAHFIEGRNPIQYENNSFYCQNN